MGTSTDVASVPTKGRETAKHIRRFLVIGFFSVFIDLAIYALLTYVGVYLHLAKAVSYVCGMVFGYVGNKVWTFESARRSASEPLTFILLYISTLGVNVVVNGTVLVYATIWFSPQLASVMAFLSATALTTVLNFIGMRFVTFRRGIREHRDSPVDGTSL